MPASSNARLQPAEPAVRDRTTRQREVDFARGCVRHEGGILTDEIERLNARYIAGEIDSDELTNAILRSHTVQPH